MLTDYKMTRVAVLLLALLVATSSAFTSLLLPMNKPTGTTRNKRTVATCIIHTGLYSTPPDKEDSAADPEGADMAAQLFQMAQQKGISVGAGDLDFDEDEEEDEEEEEDDEPELNLPQGAVNAFLGYDTGDVGEKLAGNVTLTNDQLYNEVKERVLDTAGGFVDFVRGAKEEEDDDDNDNDDPNKTPPPPYESPTTVPDSELTAGEVVLVVLEALLNNDTPSNNRGVELLFGYASTGSQILNEDGLTPKEYAEFLKETEYKVLFDHQETVSSLGC
jgi:hypothetical protein